MTVRTKADRPQADPSAGLDDTAPVHVSEVLLASPTIGAWMRANDVDGWSAEGKVQFVVALVHEAQRRVLVEPLDSITRFLATGATPDQAIERIERLVDQYRGRP